MDPSKDKTLFISLHETWPGVPEPVLSNKLDGFWLILIFGK